MLELFDRARIGLRYYRKFGRWPDLRAPTRLSEHIQLAKLTWRSPRMTTLADKVRAKAYVADRLGKDWITDNLYTGRELPPRSQRNWQPPYVIKVNHRSGCNMFVMPDPGTGGVRMIDRSGRPIYGDTPSDEPDWPAIEATLARWLRPQGRRQLEWAYRDIEPQVLVEPFLGHDTPPFDYKINVFGGRAHNICVTVDRFVEATITYRDLDWQDMKLTEVPYRMYTGELPPPVSLAEMIRGAELLAEGFPFVRIDLYEIDNRPRFSEATFYPYSGITRYDPPEWDERFGRLWPDGLPD